MKKMCPQQYDDPNFSTEEVAYCFEERCMAWDKDLGGCVLIESAKVTIRQARHISAPIPEPRVTPIPVAPKPTPVSPAPEPKAPEPKVAEPKMTEPPKPTGPVQKKK